VYGTGPVLLSTTATGFTLIPGLSTTITVPTDSFVYIATDGGVATTALEDDDGSVVDVALVVDNALPPSGGGYAQLAVANSPALPVFMSQRWSMSVIMQLSAGTHTIDVRARTTYGADANVSGDGTSVSQGSLNVVVLKR